MSKEQDELKQYYERELSKRHRAEQELIKQLQEVQETNTALVGMTDSLTHYLEKIVEERTTELEKARDVALDAVRSKSNFLAVMSHELRTPLTAIIGYAENSMEDNLEREEFKSNLLTIVRNANHLLELINDILDFSKIEANKLEIETVEFPLMDVLNDINIVARVHALEKDLDFEIKYDFPLPTHLMGDPTRLKQILINLCNNAVKFTERGHVHLHIAYEPRDDRLECIVEDTGIGIPEEKLKRLFQPFTQADSSTTRKYGGTGLGLSICKQLAEKMNGNIFCTSQDGVGSKFHIQVELPIGKKNKMTNEAAVTDDYHKITSFSHEGVPELKGNILLAEDWEDNQKLISSYIHKTHANVDLVSNGQEVLEQALIGDYNLILMDIQMPILDGVAATEMIRSAGILIPIIALTANVLKEDIDKYLSSGFNDWLAKPIDRVIFYEKISKHLEKTGKEIEANFIDKFEDSHEFRALVAEFISSLPKRLQDLETFIEQDDWENIGRLAHSIRGMGGSFGYPDLTDIASKVELHVQSGEFEDALNHTSSLTQLMHKVVQDADLHH